MMETYLMKGMFIPHVSLWWGNQRMEKATKKRERDPTPAKMFKLAKN